MKPSSSLSNDGSRLDERESHERQEQTDPSVPFLCAVPDSAARLEGTAASNRENEPVAQDYVLLRGKTTLETGAMIEPTGQDRH